MHIYAHICTDIRIYERMHIYAQIYEYMKDFNIFT